MDDFALRLGTTLPRPLHAVLSGGKGSSGDTLDAGFTPDGHLVGSIGEVVAAEASGLRLHRHVLRRP